MKKKEKKERTDTVSRLDPTRSDVSFLRKHTGFIQTKSLTRPDICVTKSFSIITRITSFLIINNLNAHFSKKEVIDFMTISK